jgi:hypothetical protein
MMPLIWIAVIYHRFALSRELIPGLESDNELSQSKSVKKPLR